MPRIEAFEPSPGLFWPVLRVVIRLAAGGEVEGPAMVDSGADYSIVPFEALQPASVSWASLQRSQSGVGAGGRFETRLCPGVLRWRTWDICSPVPVAAPGRLEMALLGRDDFFKMFVVRFGWHHNPPWFQVDPVTKTGGLTTVTPRKGAKKKRRR